VNGKRIRMRSREREREREGEIGERENDSKAHTHKDLRKLINISDRYQLTLEPVGAPDTHMTVVSIREFVKMSTGETVCFGVWSLGVQSPSQVQIQALNSLSPSSFSSHVAFVKQTISS